MAALLALSSCTTRPAPDAKVLDGPGDTVVLVHGLRWWSQGGMGSMKRAFHRDGYRVIAVRYPSRHLDCERLAHDHIAPAVRENNTRKDRPVHFVAHSMGAILTHRYLQDHAPENLGRCVFLGTPHHGTHVADLINARLPIIMRLIGTAAASLNTSERGFHHHLKPPRFPLGVIMGDSGNYPFLSAFIPGPDDGVVPVESGRIKGARDFLVVHEDHIRMLKSTEVFEQARDFIQTGAFDHTRPTAKKAPPAWTIGRR